MLVGVMTAFAVSFEISEDEGKSAKQNWTMNSGIYVVYYDDGSLYFTKSTQKEGNGVMEEKEPSKSYDDYRKGKAYPWSYCYSSVKTLQFTFPGGMTIAPNAFVICSNLTVSQFNGYVTQIGDNAFSGCEKLRLLSGMSGIKSIGNGAFKDCKSLDKQNGGYELVFKDLEWIGASAFSNCENMSQITLSDKVEFIGDNAFYGCSKLTKLTVGNANGCTTLGEGVFAYSGLQSVSISDSVTSIPAGAFSHCTSLSAFAFPSKTASIGAQAFERCDSLQAIEIPDSVTSIGKDAFKGCGSLLEIVFGTDIQSIDADAFPDHTFYDADAKRVLSIPEDLEEMKGCTFRGSSTGMMVKIPNTVTFDHSSLAKELEAAGLPTESVSSLTGSMKILGSGYPVLSDVGGFTHVGWVVGGEEYPADQAFVTQKAHVAASVWMASPAVRFDHSGLIALTGSRDSVAGLPSGMAVGGDPHYPQLESRDGCDHIGWMVDGKQVAPDAAFVSGSRTAASLWSSVPTVIFDHSALYALAGEDAQGISSLVGTEPIQGNTSYIGLGDVAGYRHTGWEIDGVVVKPTADLLKDTTHTAKSVWKKIGTVIPIIQDEDVIEVVMEKESEPWLGKDAKNVLLIAIAVAIIAELAVLAVSERR